MQVANVCSYKLGLKNEFQFSCELGWFLHGQSQIMIHGVQKCGKVTKLINIYVKGIIIKRFVFLAFLKPYF